MHGVIKFLEDSFSKVIFFNLYRFSFKVAACLESEGKVEESMRICKRLLAIVTQFPRLSLVSFLMLNKTEKILRSIVSYITTNLNLMIACHRSGGEVTKICKHIRMQTFLGFFLIRAKMKNSFIKLFSIL